MDAATPASQRLALVFEDDAPARHALVLLLRHWKWEALAVDTVAGAIESLNASPSRLMLDLMLPDGNGVTVLRHVRVNGLPIRVAVTTGTNDPDMLSEIMSLRPDVLYRKPLDIAAMARWLTECEVRGGH